MSFETYSGKDNPNFIVDVCKVFPHILNLGNFDSSIGLLGRRKWEASSCLRS